MVELSVLFTPMDFIPHLMKRDTMEKTYLNALRSIRNQDFFKSLDLMENPKGFKHKGRIAKLSRSSPSIQKVRIPPCTSSIFQRMKTSFKSSNY